MIIDDCFQPSNFGPIPENWCIQKLGQIFDIKAGGDFDKATSSDHQSHNHPYPIYSNALTNGGLYGFCSSPRYARNSVTVTARGMVGVANFRPTDFTAIGRVLVLSPTVEMDPRFFANFINERITFAIESTGVPQLTAPQLALYEAVVPPVPEQKAIATALKDIDDLIASLDALIAKKRDIKQAVMQHLLSGKVRLAGFEGGWTIKFLGELSKIKTGSRNNQEKSSDGEYPFFVRSATVEKISTYSYDCEAILVPGEGGIGSIFHYVNGRFDAHQRVYVINDFKEIDGRYLYYKMAMNFGAYAMQNSVKATVDSLRLPTFQSFEVHMPVSIKEQKAIANTLDAFVDEIAMMENRKKKLVAVKDGMMQQLLTGRIRLV